MLVADLLGSLDDRFPLGNAASWDPIGLQLGDPAAEAGSVAVTHEVTGDVVEAVLSGGITTLVSYHPLLFAPVTAIAAGATPGGRALRLLEAGVSLLVIHTALDAARSGTADALLASLGVDAAGAFGETEEGSGHYIGRYGSLPEAASAGSLASTVSETLVTSVQMAGDSESTVRTVAVVPGSGSAFIDEAVDLADAFITGDVSHHRARSGRDLGLVVIDAGHVPTERPGVEYLYDSVRGLVPDAVFIASDPHPWEDVPWKT